MTITKQEPQIDHDALQHLHESEQKFIHRIAADYRLTYQEIKEICETASDFKQWSEISLREWWSTEERKFGGIKTRETKKWLIKELRARKDVLKNTPSKYSDRENNPSESSSMYLEVKASDKKIYGMCPVASKDTICCNLRTIDAVENCGFRCSYCTIQTFYSGRITFDKNLREKLKAISLDSDRFYHIGTGQSSDSLMWGNHNGVLDDLCEFAKEHPNVILEFKTKSDNVSYFLLYKMPRNIVISWSLNTDTIIKNEEHRTVSLERRLKAARCVADRGISVGFHFHPLVYYEDWQEEYLSLVEMVKEKFSPEEISFISFGTVTLIKPVIKQIRARGAATKILQMPMVQDPKGKLTYPDTMKVEMFAHMLQAFEPWRDQVFMYLCMEKADIWKETFGFVYPDNEAFEQDFCRRAMLRDNL